MVIAVKTNPQKFMMDGPELFEKTAIKNEASKSSDQPKLVMTGQEFVGNCKEFRIDNNKTHLRIIGNCNKIRLNNNNGHLEVIGNTTRVKIAKNSGKISYTGNSGKVYLGRESPSKQVDYIGNNGILKVVPEDNLTTQKIHIAKSKKPSRTNQNHQNTEEKSEESYVKMKESKIPPAFSIEIGTDSNDDGQCQQATNVSTPNLDPTNYCNVNNISNSIRIANSSGNIVINNSYRLLTD